MRVLSNSLLGTTAVVATFSLVATSCQLDKLIGDPGEPQPPVVSLSRIQDSAAVGSTANGVVQIQLDNPGTHAISWTAVTNGSHGWLTLDRGEDTAPSVLTVTLSPLALDVGAYRDTIVVARADRPEVHVNLPVTYQILPCHLIDVSYGDVLSDDLAASDCAAPHRAEHYSKVFRIYGDPEDSLSVILTSPDFGPHLVLTGSLDPTQNPLLEVSTCDIGPTTVCVGHFSLADVRPLFLEVTSQTPFETGNFSISVDAPQPPLNPDALGQFSDEHGSVIPQGGTVPNNEMFVRGTIQDNDPMDSVRLEIEIQPIGTTFSGVPTHQSVYIRAHDTARIHIEGLVDDTGYQWQARSWDLTGRASEWIPFGVSDPDFQVRVEDAPLIPPYIGQFRSDQLTPIPPGGTIQEQTVALKGTVVDNDPESMIRLEVEVQPINSPFQGTPTASSVLVPNGETATVVVTNLIDQITYQWQARAVDQNGLEGPWAVFGDSHTEEWDFGVNVNASQLVVTSQPTTGVATQTLEAIVVEARKPSGVLDTQFSGSILVDILPGTGSPGATLSGTTIVRAQQGIATFDNLSIDLAGKNYRLTFLTAGIPPALSGGITIHDVTPTQMAIVTQPSARAQNGTVLAQQPVIELRDALGNPTTLAGISITASLASGPLGVLSGTTTVSTNDAGRAVFTDLAITGLGGTYTLAFTEANGRLPQVVSDPIVVVAISDVDPSASTADVPPGTAGQATEVPVTIRNAAGEAVSGAVVLVTAVMEVESANARAAFEVVANGDSTYTLAYKPQVAGTDIFAILVNGTPIAGSPFTSEVSTPPVIVSRTLTIVTQPSLLVQEGKQFPQQPVVALVDSTGNRANLFGFSVIASLASGDAELRGTLEIATDSLGVATFTDLEIKGDAGPRTLLFTLSGEAAVESVPIEAVKGNPDRDKP